MEKAAPLDAMTKIVEILTPLSFEDRTRAIRAAMTLLGDERPSAVPNTAITDALDQSHGELGTLPPRAQTWMKQNGISVPELEQVFHIAEGVVEVIAAHMPGRNKKEQTYNAYILTGLGQLLLTGNPSFQDKPARALCESSGCYDSANHSAHIKDRGNEFTGSKEKGWILTAPGLKRAAALVKELGQGVA